MLDQTFACVQMCWDRHNRVLDTQRLDRLLEVASSGERQMARFFRDVWQGGSHEGQQPFTLIEAIGTVDARQADIILGWMISPCRP
jgi:hypothetical protein